MAAPLVDRSTGDIIPASDHNDVKDYIEDGTYRVNTLSLSVGGNEAIDSSRNWKGTAVLGNENKAGSDCSGSDGDLARVLTLANTRLTKVGCTQVYRGGAMIMPSDLTIVDNASASTVTFTNINIFNDDIIRVIYFY